MRASFLTVSAVFPFVLSALLAQTGTIGVVKNSSSLFSLIDPNSGTVNTINVGAYLPGTTATANSVIFESASALLRRWIVSGNGFIGRIQFSSLPPPTAPFTYTVLATGISANKLIGKNSAGDILFLDLANDQVMKLNTAGTVSAITSGPQPWGSGLAAGMIHSVSGDLFLAASDGDLFRIPVNTTVPLPFGLPITLIQSHVEDLVEDPLSTSLVLGVRGNTNTVFNRIVRVSPTGPVQDLVPVGTVDGFGLAVNEDGDFLVGTLVGLVTRIPNAGGGQFLVANVTSPPSPASIRSLAVNGSLRSVLPHLSITAPSVGTVTIDVRNCTPGNTYRLLISLQQLSPTGIGPVFGVGFDAFSQIFSPVVFGSIATNGANSLSFTGVPTGIDIDAVALEVSPAILLEGVSNVVAFSTL